VARCQAVFLSVVLIVVVLILIIILVVFIFIFIVIVEIVVIFIFVVLIVVEVVFVLVVLFLFLVFVPPARSHDSGQWERGAGATGKLALQTQYLQQINNVRHEKVSLETGWWTKGTEG
jgi:energy-coupling factor transporter transmembrane protein EcfT